MGRLLGDLWGTFGGLFRDLFVTFHFIFGDFYGEQSEGLLADFWAKVTDSRHSRQSGFR